MKYQVNKSLVLELSHTLFHNEREYKENDDFDITLDTVQNSPLTDEEFPRVPVKPKSRLSAVLVLLLTGVGLLLHYHRVVFSPNTVVTGATMDGLKNYYTPWYHVAHDDAYFWFEGMNYPYGEQPVFADAQPLLSNIIRFVSRNLVDVSDYTVGILNLALFFGLMWAAWLLFLILKRFRVEPVLAAVAASALTLLSPQMLKITGHYALGYAFVVPLVWYL
ncbi:MAG: hypothetical protein AAF597_21565, partial [Bacteroidota bacterium]